MIRVSARAHFVIRGMAAIAAAPVLVLAGVAIGLAIGGAADEAIEIQLDEDHVGLT